MNFVTTQLQSGDFSMISPYVSADQKNSTLNILHFSQTGLGLPDHDYYFVDDPSVAAIQKAYKIYLTSIFKLVGDTNANEQAEKVYAIEKQLAASHKTRVERRVIKENYNKLAVSDLNTNQKNIGWNAMLKTLGAAVDSVDVRQTAYYETLNSMLETVSLYDWKLYLKANSIGSHDGILSKPFQDAAFAYS